MNQPVTYSQIKPQFNWKEIDTILFDMDGTLLDKYYDDFFWLEYVPRVYARKNSCTTDEASQFLYDRYKQVENTLEWTDLDYWSSQLHLDIPSLKHEVKHLINILPHVEEFLSFVTSLNKNIYITTNADPKALSLKMQQVPIGHYFKKLVCSKDVGASKEQQSFWQLLHGHLEYTPERTLFIDDTIKVLDSAKSYGIGFLLCIAKPSSKLPAQFAKNYPSITFFDELLPDYSI